MASFIFSCPQCGRPMEVQEEWIGMEAKCPHCGQRITIERPGGAPDPAAVRPETQEEKQCPFCGRMIKKGAVFCKYCKRDLSGVSGGTVQSEPEKTFPYICPDCETFAELPLSMEGREYECKACAESHIATPATGRKCPYCGEEIKIRATVCRYCRKQVPPLTSGPERKSPGGIFGGFGQAALPMPQTAQSSANVPRGREFWGITGAEKQSITNLTIGWSCCKIVLVITGLLSTFASPARFAPSAEQVALGWINILVGVLCCVFFCLLFYKYWDQVPRTIAWATPGKAVGFLFIPLFNLFMYPHLLAGLARHYKEFDDSSPIPLMTATKINLWLWCAGVVMVCLGIILFALGDVPGIRILQFIGCVVGLAGSVVDILWTWLMRKCACRIPSLD